MTDLTYAPDDVLARLMDARNETVAEAARVEMAGRQGYGTTCECEMDWNCPLHQHRAGTWIETRYDGLDAAEALAYGRPWDA